ncbi:hypothetical protein [Aureispira sp. CCB-QB1]|uniref:hypothetical protein n=1 Tax=Aureispira sp. CCB-QB1 TaxID=1313421 RepID=UPI000695BEA7|nr:hypothetical protein [Aureispira sp. CCB-QB1]
MKTTLLAFCMSILGVLHANAQTEIGIEIGQHLSDYIGQPQVSNIFSGAYTTPGLKAGFFLEREVSALINIRTSLFYNFRYLNFPTNDWYPYQGNHCFSLPIQTIFKAGRIVHFSLGLDPMLLLSEQLPTPQFHLGVCGSMAFRIRKKMRLSFYLNIDLIPIKLIAIPKSHSLIAGVSFAFVFKKMKKRRVIYSPG